MRKLEKPSRPVFTVEEHQRLNTEIHELQKMEAGYVSRIADDRECLSKLRKRRIALQEKIKRELRLSFQSEGIEGDI